MENRLLKVTEKKLTLTHHEERRISIPGSITLWYTWLNTMTKKGAVFFGSLSDRIQSPVVLPL
jgi:hypothetical protein